MKTISIFNQKGGVGKTTSVVNLAVSLSKLNKKVLVIDFDPQANTTTGLGFDKNELEKSIYKLFYDEGDNHKDYILKSEEGPYLIASENSLSGLEVEERLKMLSQIIEELKKDFDIILIDCPPSLGLLSLNALVASDSIIIPIQTEYYALEGVSELLKTYQTIKESIKEDLEIEGVLLCMFDKDTDLSYEVVEEVKSFFKEKVFSTMIPRNIKLAEAPSFGKSVISYDEKSKGARAYLSLAKELVENIFGKKENLEKNSKIEEKNDNLNNAEMKNLEKTKEIRDEKSKEDKNIVKNDKKENSDEAIVKKNKFSFNQNKLINNEKRD